MLAEDHGTLLPHVVSTCYCNVHYQRNWYQSHDPFWPIKGQYARNIVGAIILSVLYQMEDDDLRTKSSDQCDIFLLMLAPAVTHRNIMTDAYHVISAGDRCFHCFLWTRIISNKVHCVWWRTIATFIIHYDMDFSDKISDFSLNHPICIG